MCACVSECSIFNPHAKLSDLLYSNTQTLARPASRDCAHTRTGHTETNTQEHKHMYECQLRESAGENEMETDTDTQSERVSNVNTIFHLPTEFIFTVVRFTYQLLFGCSFSFSPTVHMNAFTIFCVAVTQYQNNTLTNAFDIELSLSNFKEIFLK